MDWDCGSANILLGGKTGLRHAFLWPAAPSLPCSSAWNNPSKTYPITIMFFISHLPMFNTKGGSKFTIHSKGFKLVALCSLSGVTLTCAGGAGVNEFKKWQICLKQGTLSTRLASPSQPHEGPAQLRHGGGRFEPSVRRNPFVSWGGSILLFKISEQQCGSGWVWSCSQQSGRTWCLFTRELFTPFWQYFKVTF